VRFSPNVLNPVIVSAGWDKTVKVSAQLVLLPHLHFVSDMMQYQNICYFRGYIPMRLPFITKISDHLHRAPNLGKNPMLTRFSGLGAAKVQAQDQPLRPHRLHQHYLRLP
jgi:hypothetical protein